MNHDQFRPIVRHLRSAGKTAKQIHEELVETHGEQVPGYSTVTRWVRDIGHFDGLGERGRSSGRPRETTTPENIGLIKDMVESNRKFSLRQLSERSGIPYTTVQRIVTNELGMQKLFARWVPKTLTTNEKLLRFNHAKKFSETFGANWGRYRNRVITVDETWVSYHPDVGIHATAEWRYAGESKPERPSAKLTTLKVMVTIFWDCRGILLIDYLPRKTTFSSEYYCTILDKLKEELRAHRPDYRRHGYWLLQDNARVHTSRRSMKKIREIGLKPMEHPPYSPDLSPSDYYLFRNLKSELKLRTFDREDEIDLFIRAYFELKESDWFAAGIDELPERMQKVIHLEGSYIHD